MYIAITSASWSWDTHVLLFNEWKEHKQIFHFFYLTWRRLASGFGVTCVPCWPALFRQSHSNAPCFVSQQPIKHHSCTEHVLWHTSAYRVFRLQHKNNTRRRLLCAAFHSKVQRCHVIVSRLRFKEKGERRQTCTAKPANDSYRLYEHTSVGNVLGKNYQRGYFCSWVYL